MFTMIAQKKALDVDILKSSVLFYQVHTYNT